MTRLSAALALPCLAAFTGGGGDSTGAVLTGFDALAQRTAS